MRSVNKNHDIAIRKWPSVIKSTDNIIWGHPTIGKSYLKEQGDNRFITLDDDYANEVNDFIDKHRGNQTRQEYKGSKPKEYNDFMLSLFDRLKVQAKKEGKKLFVSNTNILKERMSEFDKVINLSKNEFKKRFDKRGSTYGFEDWKSDIDETISKVTKGKIINTEGYLSDLLTDTRKSGIVPSIKGHAAFSTDSGIGWFRSDDKLDNIKYELATSKHNTDEHRFSYGEFIKNKNSVRVTRNVEGDYSIHEGDLSDLSKSERIKLFEKQSSVIPVGGKIVQRGASSFDGIRHRINLKNHGFSIEYGTDNLQEYKSTDKNAVQEFSNAYNLGSVIEKDGKLFTKGVILTKNIDIKPSTKTRRILEVQSDLFQKGRDRKDLVKKITGSMKVMKTFNEFFVNGINYYSDSLDGETITYFKGDDVEITYEEFRKAELESKKEIKGVGKYFNPASGHIEYKLKSGKFIKDKDSNFELSNEDLIELFGSEFIRDLDPQKFRDIQLNKIL